MGKLKCPDCNTRYGLGKLATIRNNKVVKCSECGYIQQVTRSMLMLHCFTLAYLAAVIVLIVWVAIYDNLSGVGPAFVVGGLAQLALLWLWYNRLEFGELDPATAEA